jgi:hypothetical protein
MPRIEAAPIPINNWFRICWRLSLPLPSPRPGGVENPVNQFTTPGPGERIVAYPPQPDPQPR